MGYADLAAVRQILDLEQAFSADAADATARLEALDEALSALFDAQVGRSWQGDGTQQRTVAVPASGRTERLLLPDGGLRSLTSVTLGATWNGTTWIGGNTLAVDEVRAVQQTRDGNYLALDLVNGWQWRGTVLVRGVWASDQGSPPADVREALTFVVAEEFKAERASPEAMLGPDGLQVSTRNPWRYDRVRQAIEAHRVVVV